RYRAQLATQQDGVKSSVAGTSTGAEAVASEALQILGQIVADRASGQAYQLIKIKLKKLLGCNEDGTSQDFGATCAGLVPLRIQDLAMSRDALLAALVTDAIKRVKAFKDVDSAEHKALAGVLATAVLPLVTRPRAVLDDSVARAILTAITSFAAKEVEE